MGERTGSRVFQWVWSYVLVLFLSWVYNTWFVMLSDSFGARFGREQHVCPCSWVRIDDSSMKVQT
ncbi:hypothetical protein B0T13DRAFT_480382 [Neurospora crassa]|nr:hypothetical protein B0T13DRAFT_480382 [Neurospora crassa]